LNAGDGQHEHPSQALLDLLTICATIDPINPRLSLLKDKKIAIIGDILHSRVARSNIWSLTASGAQVHLAAPPTLLPTEFEDYCQSPRNGIESSNLFIHWQVERALKDADFVMTLRLQQERMTDHLLPSLREYHQFYGITRERLKLCHPDVKILHPGPTNRGVEITSDVMDDPGLSLIAEQVNNGVATRMALLYLMGNTKDNH
jgi:aspartate carbamoyltransferase catalytic subunit